MKRILSKTAFTLVELIVSSVLVAIVLLGIFSINMVLSNSNQDYGQRYLVKSGTQITLNHILNNASLAVGSENTISGSLDLGILVGTADLGNSDPTNNPNSFCIHQDISPALAPNNYTPNNTLTTYTDDRWLCYTLYGAAAATPNQVFYCSMPYVAGAKPWGASSCNGIANSQFLGTAFSITNTALTNLPSSPYLATSATQLLFSINILNCLDNSAATCKASGTSSAPADNPEVQLSGSIIPLQEST